MSIFSDVSYKIIIKRMVATSKSLGGPYTFAAMARASKTQKTYISRVLNADEVHFSRDQLFRACRYLQMDADEIDYCLLTLDHATAQDPERRHRLRSQIVARQEQALTTKSRLRQTVVNPSLEAATVGYYLDANATLVHMLLTIDEFRADPARIVEALHLPPTSLMPILRNLESMGAIKLSSNGETIETVSLQRHLERSNPLTSAHQALMKLKCLEHCSRVDEAKRFNFVLTFSANERTRRELQRIIVDSLKDAETLVGGAPCEGLYQLNIDLFSWL